jgi:diguanylate cyclase (GGDEF)-like protein/PAS domain S-box-containing protein
VAEGTPSYDDLRRRLDEAEAILQSLNAADAEASGQGQAVGEAPTGATERAIRAIMQLMNEGAAMLDHRGVVLQCNPQLARLLGQGSEELVGRSFESFVHERDADKWRAAFSDSSGGALAALGLQVEVARPGGLSVPVRIALCQLDQTTARVAFLVASDVEWQEARMRQLMRANRELERQREVLEVEATTDSITGAYTAGALADVLGTELDYGRRYGSPISIAVIDIDLFKQVNDEFGHAFGDTVLRGLCDRLRGATRVTDYLVRYGGDEFVVILPGTGRPGARVVAERILSYVRTEPFRDNGRAVPVTVSMGVATALPSEELSVTELMKRADRALYNVKAAGRDGWSAAADLPGQQAD